MIDLPRILVDTREKSPWKFSRWRCERTAACLETADYSLHGHKARVGIERKSVADLFGSMTTGRQRFLRELDRLAEFRHAYLVVEGPTRDIARGYKWSGVSGERMLASVFRECVGRGIAPMFCESRLDAEEVAFLILRGHWDAFRA